MLTHEAQEKTTEQINRRTRRQAWLADRLMNRARSRAALFAPHFG